ncbi:Diacylglycerol kinase family enzyme [Frankineae bacterium MT45]|nr:Diacylglycerol kinase family enzyme [Frankineae bacterium MT45]
MVEPTQPGTLPNVRVLVIVNPRATGTSNLVRDVLAHAIGNSAEVEIEQTANRGHAAALACRAMRDRVDAVVGLGGDGTINEIVNGLLTDGVHDDVPALGIVPAGSTNVFARALGIPNDPVEATGALLEAMRTQSHRRISLGRIDSRWFIFAAGVGFDAAIVEGVERNRRRGKRSTHSLYARVALREFFGSDRRHPKLSIELADGSTLEGLHNAIITNADPWTFAGNRPLRPTPKTTFDTGLGLYARTSMNSLSVLHGVAQMARSKPKQVRWGAVTRHDVSALVLRASEPMPVQVDGDLLEPRELIRVWSVPRAVSVLI